MYLASLSFLLLQFYFRLIASPNRSSLLYYYTIYKNNLYLDNKYYVGIPSKEISDIQLTEYMLQMDYSITREINYEVRSIGYEYPCKLDKLSNRFMVSCYTLYE